MNLREETRHSHANSNASKTVHHWALECNWISNPSKLPPDHLATQQPTCNPTERDLFQRAVPSLPVFTLCSLSVRGSLERLICIASFGVPNENDFLALWWIHMCEFSNACSSSRNSQLFHRRLTVASDNKVAIHWTTNVPCPEPGYGSIIIPFSLAFNSNENWKDS